MKEEPNLEKQEYNFSIGEVLSGGWNLFKQNAGNYIGFAIVSLILSLIVNLIPGINYLSGILITPQLTAGYFIYAKYAEQGKAGFENFFDGFKNFGNIALMQLISVLIILPLIVVLFVFFIPFDLFLADTFERQEMIEDYFNSGSVPNIGFLVAAGLLFGILGLLYSVLLCLALPLVSLYKISPIEAIKLSYKLVSEKLFSYLSFLIVFAIILIVAALPTCLLGPLFLGTPVYALCLYYILKKAIKDEDHLDKDIDAFGSQGSISNTETE